jgi:hypothetical protein
LHHPSDVEIGRAQRGTFVLRHIGHDLASLTLMMSASTARRRWARRPSIAFALVAVVLALASPLQASTDRDGDGLDDHHERTSSRTDPRNPDTDRDGLSDGFEVRWGLTDPNVRDSDGNGVIDSLEDPDRDHLSNRGEQRYDTDPSLYDSDGDGTKDGADDADQNGVRDALEQDRRKLPRRLRSTLDSAARDYVNNRNGCHTSLTSSGMYACVYGDTRGRIDVTLFGDSHALHWLPALDQAGETRSWRVTSITKSACPSVALPVEPRSAIASASCRRWRNTVKAWLRDKPQDVVILSNSNRHTLVDNTGQRLSLEAREKRWERGLAAMMKSLPKRTEVIVLADTPRFIKDPRLCLERKGKRISDCQMRRAAAILEQYNIVERRAAERLGASFADLNPVVCPYDPCPLIAGETVIWRDNGHFTETYSRQLAPAVVPIVRSVLKGKPLRSPEPLAASGLAEATALVMVHEGFFEPDTIEAERGVELELIFSNLSTDRHQISILVDDGSGVMKSRDIGSLLRRGRTAEILLSDPEPGEYVFVSDQFPAELVGRLVIK